MFKSALVALDLAPAERPIVDCLPELRQWGIDRLVLAHIVRVGYNEGASEMAREQDYLDWLEALAEPLRQAGFQVDVVFRSAGVVANEILRLADELQVSCIVAGSRGHNLVSRLFLGSTARELLAKSTMPVLLEWVEPTAEQTLVRCNAICMESLRHVVLATDFSRRAGNAENAALFLAHRAGRIDALHVLPQDDEAHQGVPPSVSAGLAGLQIQFGPAGSNGESVIQVGIAVEEILNYATEKDVSLIIIGKHGQNVFTEKLIGSTAARLSERAMRPVLMVP